MAGKPLKEVLLTPEEFEHCLALAYTREPSAAETIVEDIGESVDLAKLTQQLPEVADLLEAETGEAAPPLDDTVSLREGLNLDSVDVVGLVMQIERHFRIRLTREELEAVTRIGDLLDLIQSKLATFSPATPPSEPAAG